jgi:DNA-binding NarL/FixJ family response regulator
MIRVFLISDYELLRQGLTTLLESQSERFALVGTADHLDPETLPWGDAVADVVLLDLETDPEQILPCLRQWRSRSGPKVLLLSRHDQPVLQDKAVLAGARGVISHHSAAGLLLNAIEKVHEGQIWLGRQSIARLISSLPLQGEPASFNPATQALARLTPREQRILATVLRHGGESAREIAVRLHISESTLRNHLTSIYDKCGVNNRSGLVAHALQNGLAELLAA